MKNQIFNNLLAFVFIFLVGSSSISAQKISEKQMKKDVAYLASDELEGRDTGSKGEALAAEFVKERFEKLGLEPKGTDGFYQVFTFTPKKNPHATDEEEEVADQSGTNVIGFLDNGAPTTVIIGAHFDHLGYGGKGSGSMSTDQDQIHNGADDNASGVAMLLQIAANLKKVADNNNYLFIAFSGEEKGLFGSNYFAKNPTIELNRVNYMINMDMVGRLNKEKDLAVYGVGTSPNWKTVLNNVNEGGYFDLIFEESGVGPSDHTSFYLQDIPVLHFFTGQHEDYHKPSDDADKLNYEGMVKVADFIYGVIMDLNNEVKLEFVKTKTEDSQKAPKYSVTLGVMPDYMFNDGGMRIDGVSDGGAADNAGIEAGDIVVQMGDVKVTDMMTYMEGLSQFKKGDTTVVKVLRGEKYLDFDVTF